MTPSEIATVLASGKFGNGYPIEQFVYDGSNRVIYIGVAPQGSATSDPAWIVKQLNYTGDNLTSTRISPRNSIFDNYSSLSYS